MTDLNFQPLSDSEAGVLANVDELVEMGIPRDLAERATRAAIQALDDTLNPILERFDTNFPNLNERTLAKSLFVGGLHNYTRERANLCTMTLILVAAQYRGN